MRLISREQFKYIERLFYNFRENKRNLEAMKKDMIEMNKAVDYSRVSVQTSNIVSECESYVEKILTNPFIVQLEKEIKLVEKVLNRLDENHYELYHRVYDRKESLIKASIDLYVSQDTTKNWRREIVYYGALVACEMQLIQLK